MIVPSGDCTTTQHVMNRRLHLIPIAACAEIGAEVGESVVAKEVFETLATLCDASAVDKLGTLLFST